MININSEPDNIRTQNVTKEAYEIYTAEIYPNNESIMCEIHDSFQKNGDKAHNCIGCNFAEFTRLLQTSLANYPNVETQLESFSSALLYSYLLVERFDEIFKIVGLPEAYKKRHFQIFGKIRRWTNFLKHPKAFILVHHPVFVFENDVKLEESDKEIIQIIDQDFIDLYYGGDVNNAKLYNLLMLKMFCFKYKYEYI